MDLIYSLSRIRQRAVLALDYEENKMKVKSNACPSKMRFLMRLKKQFLLLASILNMSVAFSDTAFMTDLVDTTGNSSVYMFDTNNPSAVTQIITGLTNTDGITVSPDAKTVYFTTWNSSAYGGAVLTFPVEGPYVPTAIVTNMDYPIGVAISSDGNTCYVVTDTLGIPGPGIYSFPTGVINPPITTLTATGTTITGPTFIVINGDTAYVGDFNAGAIYSFPVIPGQSTYNATLIQSPGGVGGLAVSTDGYLYWSEAFNSNNIFRVLLSSPTSIPETIGVVSSLSNNDGLAITNDGTTCFVGQAFFTTNFSFPTNLGPSQPAIASNSPGAIAFAIVPIPKPPTPGSILPPTNLTVSVMENRFLSQSAFSTRLVWNPSPSASVVSYRIYRNGSLITTVSASVTSLQVQGVSGGNFQISAVDSSGNESAKISG